MRRVIIFLAPGLILAGVGVAIWGPRGWGLGLAPYVVGTVVGVGILISR